MHYRQPHTGALPLGFCGEKRIENPVQINGIDAFAVVGNAQPDMGTGMHIGVLAGEVCIQYHLL